MEKEKSNTVVQDKYVQRDLQEIIRSIKIPEIAAATKTKFKINKLQLIFASVKKCDIRKESMIVSNEFYK